MIELILRNKGRQTIFTLADIANFTGKEPNANLIANINYYASTGKLLAISKGLYALDNDYSVIELGNKLRRPSYLSFYSVLQKDGVVFQEYNVVYYAANRSEEVASNGNKFKYRKLKDDIFFNPLGIISDEQYSYASTERAICDKLYLDGIEYLDNLSNINWKLMQDLASEVYKSKELDNTIQKLKNAE